MHCHALLCPSQCPQEHFQLPIQVKPTGWIEPLLKHYPISYIQFKYWKKNPSAALFPKHIYAYPTTTSFRVCFHHKTHSIIYKQIAASSQEHNLNKTTKCVCVCNHIYNAWDFFKKLLKNKYELVMLWVFETESVKKIPQMTSWPSNLYTCSNTSGFLI